MESQENKAKIDSISLSPRVFLKSELGSSGRSDGQKRNPKFADSTICKVLAKQHERIEEVKNCLKTWFNVEETSAIMFSADTELFFQFLKVSPKTS